MQKIRSSVFFYLFLACLFGCGQQGILSGGDKDTEPPVMDKDKSTPNFQTQFKKQDLEFHFNEWVQLKDPFKQVVISPPLEKRYVHCRGMLRRRVDRGGSRQRGPG